MIRHIGTRLSLVLLALLVAGVVSAQGESPDGPDEGSVVITTHDGPPDASAFTLVEVLSGLRNPLYATGAGDDSGRLFVMEQAGRIWILQNDILQNTPFLDLSGIVSQDVLGGYSERGLLGLAFHPNFAENGQFFVNYTDRGGTSVVARYRVSEDDLNVADPDSAEVLLTLGQPYANHNGGHMDFGPDGYLYISFGDGGAANDPLAAGQNPGTLLGTLLRIDVDTSGEGRAYGIPADNPVAENPMFAPEVWAFGLRNVWRFSFDSATGDLYMGDVGQSNWEEINFEPADSAGGNNYGWLAFEGRVRYRGPDPITETVMPIAVYDHAGGNCSVTGGYVYRGSSIPEIDGYYFYSDYCSGRLWSAYRSTDGEWQSGVVLETNRSSSSFGVDDDNELYLVDYSGTLLRFEPANR